MAEIKERKKKNGEKSFTVSIRIKGAQAVNKTFSRKTDAVEWANKMEVQIKENINFPYRALNRMTVGELIDRYVQNELPLKKEKLRGDYSVALAWYKKEIGSIAISSLTTLQLVECRDKLLEKNKQVPMSNGKLKFSEKALSPSTVNKYMAKLRSVFNYAVDVLEVIGSNPMAKVKKLKEDNARTRYLEKSEINRLLTASKESSYELYLCVLIALLTGARKGEILNLTWKTVDLTHKMFYFIETKNKTSRGVPIHEFLYQELVKYKNMNNVRHLQNDYLFMAENGKPKESLIGEKFPEVVKQIHLEHFRFHDLRHTDASWQAMSGVSQPITQKTLGHKTPAMTNRYSHLRDENLRKTINEVGDIMLTDWFADNINSNCN